MDGAIVLERTGENGGRLVKARHDPCGDVRSFESRIACSKIAFGEAHFVRA